MLERSDDAERRGANILAHLKPQSGQSAFHGTRLDIEHIASEMNELVNALTDSSGLSTVELAKETVCQSRNIHPRPWWVGS